MKHLVRAVLAAALVVLSPQTAIAGPPFLTDDPEPTAPHRWEIYNYVAGDRANGETNLAAGLDLNYGPAKDIQLTLVLPADKEPGRPLHSGNIELAAKFKLLHQGSGSPVSLTLFPRLYLPTARGASRVHVLLPVWIEHDSGAWQVFGGGGYTLNPGPGNINFWQGGIVVNRQVAPGLQLGLEYFGQGAESPGDVAMHLLNLGTTIHLHGPFSLLGAVGKGLNHHQSVFYTALKLDL